MFISLVQIQCLELVFENVLQKYKLYTLFCSRKPCLIALRQFFQFSIISQFHYLAMLKIILLTFLEKVMKNMIVQSFCKYTIKPIHDGHFPGCSRIGGKKAHHIWNLSDIFHKDDIWYKFVLPEEKSENI